VQADFSMIEEPSDHGPNGLIGSNSASVRMKQVNLERATFHGDWNYIIRPKANHV